MAVPSPEGESGGAWGLGGAGGVGGAAGEAEQQPAAGEGSVEVGVDAGGAC